MAGCGADSTPDSSTVDNDAQMRAAVAELIQCLRSNGVPEFPDIDVQNGQLAEPSLDPAARPRVEAALEGACRSSAERVNALTEGQRQAEEQRPQMSAEDLATLRKYAECMREHGLPDFPDSDPTGRFILPSSWPPGLGKEQRPMDVVFRDAMSACEQYSVPGTTLG